MRHTLLVLPLLAIATYIDPGPRQQPDPPVGQLIRELREARGLSQIELAVRAGLSVSYIYRLEHGRKRPSVRSLRKLGAALGVDLLDLLAADRDAYRSRFDDGSGQR